MADPVATLEQISPNRGKLTIVDDGSGGVIVVTNAALLAAFAANTPLGELVRTPVADAGAAAALMLGNPAAVSQRLQGRIFMGSQIAGVLAIPPAVSAAEVALAIVLGVATVAVAGTWIFYIEQVHSQIR